MKMKNIIIPVALLSILTMASGCKGKDADEINKTDNNKVESKKENGQKNEKLNEKKPESQSNAKNDSNKDVKTEGNDPISGEINPDSYSDLPEVINEENVKNSIIQGKQILFEIFTAGDRDKMDEGNNRTGVIEKFNTIDKMKSELGPYFTDRYINDFLINILKVEEVDGELYIALGDLGLWAEYPQMSVNGIEKGSDKSITVDYMAPSGIGDINHKATMYLIDGQWKMDKESNY